MSEVVSCVNCERRFDSSETTTCDACGDSVCDGCRIDGPTIVMESGEDDGLEWVACSDGCADNLGVDRS